MLASPIRIDRAIESDVGGIVARDDGLHALDSHDGLGLRGLVGRFLEPAVVCRFTSPLFETAFGIDGRTAALCDFAVISRGGLERHRKSLPSANRPARAKIRRKTQCG